MDDVLIHGSTIDSVVFELACSDGSSAWFGCDGVRLTVAEIARRAERFAHWLVSGGVQPGDRIALWLPNGVPWVVAHVAAAAAGAVSVPVSTRLASREAEYIVEHSGSKVLVVADRFLAREYGSEARAFGALAGGAGLRVALVVVDPVAGELPEGRSVGLPGSDADAPAVVQYTSGTTGAPKGCLLSHRAWTNNARLSAEAAALTEDDVVLCPSPFFHLFGSLTGLMGTLSIGAAFLTLPKFDPLACAEAIRTHGVTHLVAVPTVWLDLMQTAPPGTLPTLRGGRWGGAGFPRAALERALNLDAYGWNLQAIYGLTEAPTLTQVLPADPWSRKLDTVGRATSGVEVRTVDPATSTTMGPGEVGEIWARGYNAMIGYLEDPDATAVRFSGEWIRSGDLGVIDEGGFLRVTGRITDMILTGGANVYAREVENVILDLEGASLAAVVGREDERLGEVPVAWVAVGDDESLDEMSIIAHCRRSLADYKVPRRVFVVPELPLTASGKIHKALLKERSNRKGT